MPTSLDLRSLEKNPAHFWFTWQVAKHNSYGKLCKQIKGIV